MKYFITEALRIFNEKHSLSSDNAVTLDHFKEAKQVLTDWPIEANKVSQQELGQIVIHIETTILALGSLSASALENKNANQILKTDYSAKDMFLGNYLINICNTAMCICRNACDGFDTQARILVRALDERLYQAILLFYSESDYALWHKTDDEAQHKAVHYALFSKKGRLHKRLHQIENELGLDMDETITEWRIKETEYFSAPVHGAGITIHAGSWAFLYGSDRMEPALFGRSSAASIHTLEHTRFQLFHFSVLLKRLLEQRHGWKANLSKYFDLNYEAFHHVACCYSQIWINQELSKNRDNTPPKEPK